MGGWMLEALEAVADDPYSLDHLEGLVNKSLVVTEEGEHGMRFSMLETIRQYAREKLFDAQEAIAVRDRHFFYYDQLSQAMWNNFSSLKDYSLLRDRAAEEQENLRLALDWGMQHQPEMALHMAANYNVVSSWTGNQIEGLATLKTALEIFQNLPPVDADADLERKRLIAKAMFSRGMTSMSTGGIHIAIQSLQEAIAIARQIDEERTLGYSLEMLYTASAFDDALQNVDGVEEGYHLFEKIDDNWGKAMSYMNMARVEAARGNENESQKYFGMFKELTRDSPISFQTGMFLLSVGYLERFRGNLEIAKRYFEQGLIVFRDLRHKGFETVMMSEIGHIARLSGDYKQAEEIYSQTIPRFQDMGNRPAVAHQLECFAFIAIREGRLEGAVKLLGAAEALRDAVDSQMTGHEREEYDPQVKSLSSLLTESTLQTLWEEGRSMSMKSAVDYALGSRTDSSEG
jgi:tetratricopeptide (TPR) repeat protein